MTKEAAEKNFLVLKKYDLNLEDAIQAQHSSMDLNFDHLRLWSLYLATIQTGIK